MTNRATTTALILALNSAMLAGCFDDGTPFDSLDGDDSPAARGGFQVPRLHVGDVYTYGFGFRVDGDPPFENQGTTTVRVLGEVSRADALGVTRDALHIVQETQAGEDNFQEDYWVDAKTLKQFALARADGFQEANHLTGGPAGEPPTKQSTYANGTGTLERHFEDPLFEDFNFFAPFATGRAVEDPFVIDGNLWLRDDPTLLRSGNLSGAVEQVDTEQWGPGRRLTFEAAYDEGGLRQTTTWTGIVTQEVPLATEMTRRILVDWGDYDLDVRFNATLKSYEAGDGAAYVAQDGGAAAPARRAAGFAPWDQAPPAGTSDGLPFPFSEALSALEIEPTASQYFADHAGAYLRFAVLSEINTCGAQVANPPGCHWFSWFGLFDAPDDTSMHFLVEKYADDAGAGPSFVPPVSRDYPFELVFDTLGGAAPEPPSAPIQVFKSDADLPERGAFPTEALTTAGAIAIWREAATPENRDLGPNLYIVWLDEGGYSHFVAHEETVFPENALLFPAYDNGVLVLERHTSTVDASGRLLESRNYDIEVEHT